MPLTEEFIVIEIIILAAVAGFLFLRLREVLGTKTGHENTEVFSNRSRPHANGAANDDNGSVVAFPGAEQPEETHDDVAEVTDLDGDAGRTLVAAKLVEPQFNAVRFLDGSRSAYEMILMAFETGDKETLRSLLTDDVYDSFAASIDARHEKGLTVDARFVGIRSSKVEEAQLDSATNELDVAVRFDADMIVAVRDQSGEVVEGDPIAVRRLNDLWTFRRVLGSNDPSWVLVETA